MFRTQIYSYTETQVIESFYTLREWTMDVIHTYFECLADSPVQEENRPLSHELHYP